MAQAEIYSTPTCSSCVRAKYVLQRMGVEIVEHDVAFDREPMIERTGRHTVPQIYVEDIHIGGYEDLMKAIADGTVPKLLGIDEQPEPALEA